MTDSCTTSVHAGPALCQLTQQLPPGSVHLASATGVYDADPRCGQRHPARLPPLANSLQSRQEVLERGTDNLGYIDDATMLVTGVARAPTVIGCGCHRWAAPNASRFEPPQSSSSSVFTPQGSGPGVRVPAPSRPPRGRGQANRDLSDGRPRGQRDSLAPWGHSRSTPWLCKHLDSPGSRLSARWAAPNGACSSGSFGTSTRHASPLSRYMRPRSSTRNQSRSKSAPTAASELSRIPCWGGKLIAGAFRTVSGAAFNAELHLTPMPFVLRQPHYPHFLHIPSTPAYCTHILDRRRRHWNPLLHTPLKAAEE
jgi:hypothetical protein